MDKRTRPLIVTIIAGAAFGLLAVTAHAADGVWQLQTNSKGSNLFWLQRGFLA